MEKKKEMNKKIYIEYTTKSKRKSVYIKDSYFYGLFINADHLILLLKLNSSAFICL